MGLFSGILQTVVGAAEIAAGILIEVGTLGGGTPLALALISSGAGMVISGIGTILAGNGPVEGFATTQRHPTAPWNTVYGTTRVGGDLVYMHSWGTNNQMLDLVVVLACHPCEAVSELLFDMQRVQIDTRAAPPAASALGGGTSFTPVQQTVNISSIVRDSNGIVTVSLPANIPYLTAGDQIEITGVTADSTLNGVFQVAQIVSQVFGGPGSITFNFLCGGIASSVTTQGKARTRWADYARNVYYEPILGAQTLGHTFAGMTIGTPWQGTGAYIRPELPGQAGTADNATTINIFGGVINPWTNYCSLEGKTAVFLRLQYDKKYFPNGLPQISFLVKGKNDIYDPRTSTYSYTENPALCIADFLNQGDTTDGRNRIGWGFKAAYGTEIPDAELIDAANICDQTVSLVIGGTENRYTCNGQFTLEMKRGEILQNLLTSCAGRLTYTEGQFIIHPAKWTTPISTPVDFQAIASGPFKWRPTVSIKELYNGAKATYISPNNKWQSSDMPPYCQDWKHGYDTGHTLTAYNGDILLAADSGERRWLDLQFPFTTSSATAQRLAKIELLRRRHFGTGTFQCNMTGYQYSPMDIIQADATFLGWTNKQLEVSAVRLSTNKQSGGNGLDSVALGTEIDVQETDSAIYDWSTEEELSPQGYQQARIPINTLDETVPFPWSPGYSTGSPLAGDAYMGSGSFGIAPIYATDADGSPTASLQIKGQQIPNNLSDVGSPLIIVSATTDTGGFIPAGSYVLGFSSRDSSDPTHYGMTAYLGLANAVINTDGGTISLEITWGSGDAADGELYMGLWTADGYVMHWQQTITYGTSTITLDSFNSLSGGGPDSKFHHYGVTWMQEVHGGPFATTVSLIGTNTITLGLPSTSTDQWSGYVLSLLCKATPGVDFQNLNMPIASNTATDIDGLVQFTIGRNINGDQLPDLTTYVDVNDVVCMRHNATFTTTSFTDPNVANGFYPSGATSVEAGHIAVVLSGADAGDTQVIRSVTLDGSSNYTVFNLAGSWKTKPNTGDLVVVCEPSSVPEVVTGAMNNVNNTISTTIASPDVLNLGSRVWLFRVRAEDSNGNHCDDSLTPWRDIYFTGAGGTRQIDSDDTMLTTDSMVNCDASGGSIVYQCLSWDQVPNQTFTVSCVAVTGGNTITVQAAIGDEFEDGSTAIVLSVVGDSVTFRAQG